MSASDVVRFFVTMAFSFLNTSIIVYIYRERRAGARFQSSFFVLFLAVSLSDLVYCVLPIDEPSFQWLLIAHLPNAFGLVDLVVGMVHCKVHVVIAWCMVFQAFAHTAVAFNRYCSLGARERFSFVWTPRSVRIMLGLLAVLTTLVLWPNYVAPCEYLSSQGRISGGIVTDPTLVQVLLYTVVGVYVVCSFTAFVFSAATLKELIAVRKDARLSGTMRHEVGLAAYSLYIFVLQITYTLRNVGFLPAFRSSSFYSVFNVIFACGLGDAYLVSGPLCLLVLSVNVRKGYFAYYRLRNDSSMFSKATQVFSVRKT